MAISKTEVLERLRHVKGPEREGNIVDQGLVSEILIRDDRVYFSITVPADKAGELESLREAAETVVKRIPSVAGVTAVLTAEAKKGTAGAAGNTAEHPRVAAARARGQSGDTASCGSDARPQQAAAAAGKPQAPGVPGVRHIIAVASGKGGVGKSTTAVNLALGFQAIGLKAGILDADIYGPSQPRLLGLTGQPEQGRDDRIRPMVGYGLKSMSMGYMVDEATPIIWRGPMVVQALNQMLRQVAWADPGDEMDVLVIDMPPGTGDVQLTIAQQVPLSGAIIVSTPQDLALIDARKGLNMFRKVDVPVLGIIENMSYFVCPKCGERSEIFGHGGAEHEAEKLGLPFLGAIPLHIDIRERSDAGKPIVVTSPDSVHAQIYRQLAAKAWAEIGAAEGHRIPPPKLTVAPAGDSLHVAFEGRKAFDLTAELLRVMSPSAEVQGHSAAERITVAGKKSVKIADLSPVGNYATRIAFDDGHDTGLFTWSYLQQLDAERDARWSQHLAELKQKGLSR